jgi:quercetin dioxygenase-like cupin family protein
MSDLRYPIGKFQWEDDLSEARRGELIDQIAEAPARVRAAVAGFTEQQYDTPYREGGWTVRQVVHHLADSHMNAYVRFKLAMTEEEPTIKTYEQQLWAETPDAKTAPAEFSLTLLGSLHQRWSVLLRSMSGADFNRKFTHPEHGKITLERLLGLYAWHGRHHTAHITSLCERMNWNRVYIGEFRNDAREWIQPGWFVGKFMPRPPRQTDKVEFKYWEYDEGDVNHPEKTSATLECTLILEGEITGLIDGKMVDLHAGQYVVIAPGVANGFPKSVGKKVVGLTIKAPSDPSAKKLTGKD